LKLRNSFSKLLVGGALAVSGQFLAQPANAALLAQYQFENTRASTAPVDPNFTAGSVFNGAGIPQVASAYSTRRAPLVGGTRSLQTSFRNLSSGSKTDALANNAFYGFQLTPNTPAKAKFDSFSFLTDVGPQEGATGGFFVQANLGAGNTFIDLSPTYIQTSTPTAGFVQRTVDLAGLRPAGGFFTTPIEFRIYEFDSTNVDPGGLRIDNVELQGNVAPVPELSTGLLVALAIGGLGVANLRRKKMASAGQQDNSGFSPAI
jgi:hypothetical protein